MQDLTQFHRLVGELMRHVGLDVEPFGQEQDLISIEVDQRYELHLGMLDAAHCFVLADLSRPLPEPDEALLRRLLKYNQLDVSEGKPVAAMDDQQRLTLWLSLPLAGSDLPKMLQVFDGLLAAAHALLQPEAQASRPMPTTALFRP